MRNSVDNLSLLLQALSLQILFQELQKQDNNYFERIIKQNEEILKILKERS